MQNPNLTSETRQIIGVFPATGQKSSLATGWREVLLIDLSAHLRTILLAKNFQIEDNWLEISREQVGLRAEADIWLDVWAFQQGTAVTSTAADSPAGTASDGLTRLAEAVELYRNDFLSGFTLPDTPNFDEWQFF